MKEHDIGGGGRDPHEKIPLVDKALIQPNTVRVKFHCTFPFCNNEHKLYLLLHCCKIVIQLSTFIQSNTYIRDWNLPSGLKRASGSQSAIVGPVRTYLFLYENGDLFYPFWPLERAKKVTEHASFQKRSREWRFLKTQFYLNREDGWNMRRFLKTITSRAQIPVNAHSSIKDGTVSSHYCAFVWTGKNDPKTQRVDADSFWKRDAGDITYPDIFENEDFASVLALRPHNAIVIIPLYSNRSNVLLVDAYFLENGEKTLGFKNTLIRVDTGPQREFMLL